MPTLKKMVGKQIRAHIPFLDSNAIEKYTLHGVDASGLWISGETITQYFMQKFKSEILPKTPVFFVPFPQIAVVLDFVEGVQISETVLR